MKKHLKLFTILFVTALSSLAFAMPSNEADNKNKDGERQSKEQYTSCEVLGTEAASPGSSLTFNSNIEGFNNNVKFLWGVIEGNMIIEQYEDSNEVTLTFLNDFEGGTLYFLASDDEGIRCSLSLEIPKSE